MYCKTLNQCLTVKILWPKFSLLTSINFDLSSLEQGKEEIYHLKMNRSINERINQY